MIWCLHSVGLSPLPQVQQNQTDPRYLGKTASRAIFTGFANMLGIQMGMNLSNFICSENSFTQLSRWIFGPSFSRSLGEPKQDHRVAFRGCSNSFIFLQTAGLFLAPSTSILFIAFIYITCLLSNFF